MSLERARLEQIAEILPTSDEEAAALREEDWEGLLDRLEHEIGLVRTSATGPSLRDRSIFQAICDGESPAEVAWRHHLRPRTAQAIARTTMKWMARQDLRYGRMKLAELRKEAELWEALGHQATEACHASQRPRRRSRTGRARHPRNRFLAIAQRAWVEHAALEPQIERLARLELTEQARLVRCRVRTVPERVRRRKRMGGKRLRLPQFVRTAPVACSAVACWTVFRAVRAVIEHVGVPPPQRIGADKERVSGRFRLKAGLQRLGVRLERIASGPRV